MTVRVAFLAAAVLAAALPSPAHAQAADFVLVNGTGAPLSAVAIRRSTTDNWVALPVTAPAGGRSSVAFSNPDCAFDIRATIAGVGQVLWNGINLCGATAVILNRNGAGVLWVDYE